MWKRCRRRTRHIADTTTTLFPLTNTIWNQPVTLFPHSLRNVRTQKQRSLHHSVWSNARNAVSYLFLFGFMQSSCHKSLAHFSVAIMTSFLASNRQELPVCQLYLASLWHNNTKNHLFSPPEALNMLKIHIFLVPLHRIRTNNVCK